MEAIFFLICGAVIGFCIWEWRDDATRGAEKAQRSQDEWEANNPERTNKQ